MWATGDGKAARKDREMMWREREEKGCVAEGMKNGGWIIQSGDDDGLGEWMGGFATGGIARPL